MTKFMTEYIIKRVLQMIFTLLVISMVIFAIINLPPGDWLSSHIASLAQEGEIVRRSDLERLEQRYGLDLPVHRQYIRWFSRFVQGDYGFSFEWKRPVGEIIWPRLINTFIIALSTQIFVIFTSFVIGLYSATHKYSIGDYMATFFGFIGLATPNFMLALILMWLGYTYFDISMGGLFSREYLNAPWSWDKFVDLLKHLWVPVIVLGTHGTASMIRIMRANLLDELGKPYMVTARSKGISELSLLLKYPLRIAIIPWISTVGWLLPNLISGSIIVSVVLNLPTTGPVLLNALLMQDMYLAGTFIMFLSILTVIGTFISDLLLALVDPRIRYD